MNRKAASIVSTVLLILGIASGVYYGISLTVDYAVKENATRKALKWSNHLIAKLDNLPELISTGRPTNEQVAQIMEASEIGDVFRFKLFDETAHLVLVSDELTPVSNSVRTGDHNGKATLVLATGEAQTSVNDGTKKENRPDLYVEAYVPVKSAAGAPLGVAEVYLDQSYIYSQFHRLFSFVALAIAAILTLLFGGPWIAFLIKSDQEKASRNRANYLATHDQVANLLNRTGLIDRLSKMEKAGTFNLSRLAVIFLDIDHFKSINDNYGHKSGDAFLNHVGASISNCLGTNDLAGRMGGDEFMILVERDCIEDVYGLVERIQSLISSPLRTDGMTIVGHMSIGLDYGSGPGISIEDRMIRADIALYQAKVDGRNVHRTFSRNMEAKALRRRAIEAALASGLEENRFELHFQPLLLEKNRQCMGFEALLRLQDRNGNSISPDEFIPVAEASGQIKKIGEWVLRTAVEAAANWPEQYFVSVNLSPRQFDDNNLVALIESTLGESSLKPSRLELEVTESLLIENTELVSGQLKGLRELGISIAMDDFGTGYSSLGYLWQFGFDKLKIDRSFINGLDHDTEKALEILDTIIMLGHRLNMTVTAEGIESERQADLLAELACDHFQGFLFGRPMPQEDLPGYLLKQAVSPKNNLSPIEIDKMAATSMR